MFSKEIKLKAVNELLRGISQSEVTQRYGIKGSATLYGWKRLLEEFGPDSLNAFQPKTYYDFSFKMKVIEWRIIHQASYSTTAKLFSIKHPTLIWRWEKAFIAGRLQTKRKWSSNMRAEDQNKSKETLSEENRALRVKLAYLEKVQALIQKDQKSLTNKKPK